jgi:hypothetical protein
MFEDRVLRRIFGPKSLLGSCHFCSLSKRDEVTGGWRKLHNEELCNLYSSRNIIRMIKSRMVRWTGYVAHMGVMRKGKKTFWSEGKRPLGRPRFRWRDNIRMYCRKIDW